MEKFRKSCLNSMIFLNIGYWAFWEPDYIKAKVPVLDRVFDLAAVAVLAILIIFALFRLREMMNLYNILLIGMAAVLILSTYLNHGVSQSMWKCLKYLFPAAGVILLTEMAIKEDARKVLRVQYLMCFIQVTANAVSIALFPNGLYTADDTSAQYFLGNENVYIMTILPGLCAGFLYLLKKQKKITVDYVIYLLVSCFSVIRVWSASSIIGILFFVLLAVSTYVVKWHRPYCLVGGVLADLLFCWLILKRSVREFLAPIITGIFHKSIGLTGRAILWRILLRRIKRHPWLGYGVETARAFLRHTRRRNPHWVHSHNYYLELLMRGGYILLSLFIAVLGVTAYQLDRMIGHREAKIISITLFTFMFCFIGDCYEMRTTFYMILTLGYCIRNIVELPEESEEPQTSKCC